MTWTDVEENPSWHDGPLYQHLYVPLGVTDQLGLQLPSPPGVVGGLVCNRGRPFDQRERDLLTLLGRHVVAQLGSTTERAAAQATLHLGGWRSFLVDDDDRILGLGGGQDRSISDGSRLVPAVARLARSQGMPAGDRRLVLANPGSLTRRSPVTWGSRWAR